MCEPVSKNSSAYTCVRAPMPPRTCAPARPARATRASPDESGHVRTAPRARPTRRDKKPDEIGQTGAESDILSEKRTFPDRVCRMTMLPTSTLILPNAVTGCWEWVGDRTDEGYGRCAGAPAHRVAWLMFRGPIPDGLALDHLCRNVSCVNPDHLEPVTTAENNARKPVRARSAFPGSRTSLRTSDLSAGDVAALMTPGEVAQRMRVDPKTVTRWAIAGRLTSVRTAGGQRRYFAHEVDAMHGPAA